MSSKTMKSFIIGPLLAGLLMTAACGSPNSTATYNPESAAHPPDWLPANHMNAAREDVNSCKNCHGEDLISGGISKVSCTRCHLGGPLEVHSADVNGIPWFQAGSSSQGHGIYVVANGTAACKNIWCHGTKLEGILQSGPACSTCHPGEAF